MDKHIHTTFSSPEEAAEARDYLASIGFGDLSVEGSTLYIQTNDENWIAAVEMVNGLGGSFKGNEEFLMQIEAAYQMDTDVDGNQEIMMIDQDAYIDSNLGYGDFEMIEPYILHDYFQLSEKDE